MHAGFLVQMNVQLASESLFLMEKYHCTVQKCIFSLIWNMGGAHEKWIQKCYVPREYSASVGPRLSKKSCLTCSRILSFQIVYIWSHVCFPTFRQQIDHMFAFQLLDNRLHLGNQAYDEKKWAFKDNLTHTFLPSFKSQDVWQGLRWSRWKLWSRRHGTLDCSGLLASVAGPVMSKGVMWPARHQFIAVRGNSPSLLLELGESKVLPPSHHHLESLNISKVNDGRNKM